MDRRCEVTRTNRTPALTAVAYYFHYLHKHTRLRNSSCTSTVAASHDRLKISSSSSWEISAASNPASAPFAVDPLVPATTLGAALIQVHHHARLPSASQALVLLLQGAPVHFADRDEVLCQCVSLLLPLSLFQRHRWAAATSVCGDRQLLLIVWALERRWFFVHLDLR